MKKKSLSVVYDTVVFPERQKEPSVLEVFFFFFTLSHRSASRRRSASACGFSMDVFFVLLQ